MSAQFCIHGQSYWGDCALCAAARAKKKNPKETTMDGKTITTLSDAVMACDAEILAADTTPLIGLSNDALHAHHLRIELLLQRRSRLRNLTSEAISAFVGPEP